MAKEIKRVPGNMKKKSAQISSDLFLTYFEQSNQLDSPDYNESIAFFRRLMKASKCIKESIIGYSHQGRPIFCYIIASGREFTPKMARKNGKAVVLIQNGIHPGEIEGKDASMLLLREILISGEKKSLLKNLVLLVIPVLNVDGHERVSEYNRPNQNGPVRMGWRVNAQNLNLNRDYLKADSSEMKSALRLFSHWMPDFVIDNHTTNGADYQYHITYGIETKQIIDTELAKFAKKKLIPFFSKKLEESGFLVAPYLELKGDRPEDGFIEMVNLPRYSTGYAAVQNRICLLVETHSLKPFSNRVYSTKRINESVLEYLGNNHQLLLTLNGRADRRAIHTHAVKKLPIPIDFSHTDAFEILPFKGFASTIEKSPVLGCDVIRYSNTPVTFQVPFYRFCRVNKEIMLPDYYIIPPEFADVVRILKLHGVEVLLLNKSMELTINQYAFENVQFARAPYEGRLRVSCECKENQVKKAIAVGSFVVPVKQRTIRLISFLLEPASEDSLCAWGFFNAFFERKEYAEAYVFEPIAAEMVKDNPEIGDSFRELLRDEQVLQVSPAARLDYFYRRSSYFDERERKYPIFRYFGRLNIR